MLLVTFHLPSADAFNLDEAKILSSDKELRYNSLILKIISFFRSDQSNAQDGSSIHAIRKKTFVFANCGERLKTRMFVHNLRS